MLSAWTKKIIARLPASRQNDLRRYHFRRQIRAGRFIPNEPEMKVISELIKPGDWAIDIGANVGHYSFHLSKCVGPTGRVLAFEPVTATFSLLTANVAAGELGNVTLFNVAASSNAGVANIEIPKYAGSRMDNLYQARLSAAAPGTNVVLCLSMDSIAFPAPIRLMKIDAEGHDLQVLEGAQALIARDRPHLIVEAELESDITAWITARGYRIERAPRSPNIVAIPI